jgi:hypothetical protein
MPALVEQDWLTQSGARKLAARIENFWRGQDVPGGDGVKCKVDLIGSLGTNAPVFAIRSNLVNGLPQRK